jgi:hypothetical protein
MAKNSCPTKGARYRKVFARQNGPYLHRNMTPQVEKTWTRLCESKRPRPRVPPSREIEGAKCLGNLGSRQPEVGGHYAHPATAAAGAAALERAGGAPRSRRPLLPPDWVEVVVAAAIRYHSSCQNHRGYHV